MPGCAEPTLRLTPAADAVLVQMFQQIGGVLVDPVGAGALELFLAIAQRRQQLSITRECQAQRIINIRITGDTTGHRAPMAGCCRPAATTSSTAARPMAHARHRAPRKIRAPIWVWLRVGLAGLVTLSGQP